MNVIPFTIKPGYFNVMILIDPTSMDRIKSYDPAQLHLDQLPDPFKSMKLEEIHISYVTEEDMKFITSQEQGVEGLKKVMKHVSRGWKYRPELGDNDMGTQLPMFN